MEQCLESEGRTIKERCVAWMEEYWGDRCPDFDKDCPCCKAWVAFDVVFTDVVEPCGDPDCLMPGCQSSSSSVRTNP